MTVGEQLFDFLKQQKVPFCNDCLLKEIGRSGLPDIRTLTHAFGLTSDFRKGVGDCNRCHNPRRGTVVYAR
jgi:hypothetical protein